MEKNPYYMIISGGRLEKQIAKHTLEQVKCNYILWWAIRTKCVNNSFRKWEKRNVYYVRIVFCRMGGTLLVLSLSLFRPLPSLFICLYRKRAGLAHPFRSNSKMEKCSLESTLWQFTYIVHLLWSWHNVNPLFNCRLCIRIFIFKKIPNRICAQMQQRKTRAIQDFN